MNKTHRRLSSLLGLFGQSFTLGIVPAEGAPGAGAPAAAAPAPASPAPAAAAPTAPAPATASLREIVRASVAAVRGGKAPAAALAAITAERDAAVARADKAEADLATAQASLKSTGAQLTGVCGLLGIEAKDIAGKDAAAVSTLFQSRLQSAVSEELAGLGFPAAELPAASPTATGTGDTVADLRAGINSETDSTKRGQLVVKLRAAQAAAKKPRTV